MALSVMKPNAYSFDELEPPSSEELELEFPQAANIKPTEAVKRSFL